MLNAIGPRLIDDHVVLCMLACIEVIVAFSNPGQPLIIHTAASIEIVQLLVTMMGEVSLSLNDRRRINGRYVGEVKWYEGVSF